jgi:hypothetical protein
MISSQYKG